MSQQMMEAVQNATAPFQHALATRAGCECVAHALQGITELNPRATVTSIDGISAYDPISRRAVMQGLHDVDHTAVPFVSMFYGTLSRYLSEDDAGTTHTIVQGEGGEQGDAMMPLLFALGQHPALEAVQHQLVDGEFIFAFMDDIYFVTVPERTGIVYKMLCGTRQGSASIKGRPKYGTTLENNQLRAKFWIAWREQQIPPAACREGVVSWFHKSGAPGEFLHTLIFNTSHGSTLASLRGGRWHEPAGDQIVRPHPIHGHHCGIGIGR